MSVLGCLEHGKQDNHLRMPSFHIRPAVNGWVIQVASEWGTEEYLTEATGETAEKFRSLAERWEKVLDQMAAEKRTSSSGSPTGSYTYDNDEAPATPSFVV